METKLRYILLASGFEIVGDVTMEDGAWTRISNPVFFCYMDSLRMWKLRSCTASIEESYIDLSNKHILYSGTPTEGIKKTYNDFFKQENETSN